GGYIDGYYRYDVGLNHPGQTPYFFSSARHNNFSVNLALVDVKFSGERFRGRFAPAVGTYMEDNYAAEPQGFRNIFEASGGVRLCKRYDLWLDAGVLGSPYGYEGAISKEQISYTRSFSAENSPYYVTGARLTAALGSRASLALFAINGW